MGDTPKSTGRKAFERNWQLAQAEAQRRRSRPGGCLVILACLACLVFAVAVMVATDRANRGVEPAPPPVGTTAPVP
jgi:hypothetical protein